MQTNIWCTLSAFDLTKQMSKLHQKHNTPLYSTVIINHFVTYYFSQYDDGSCSNSHSE